MPSNGLIMDLKGLYIKCTGLLNDSGATLITPTQQSSIAALTDSSGGATGNDTLAAVVTQTAVTDSSGGGAADGTMAAVVTQTAITDSAAGEAADGTIAAIGVGAVDTACALAADVRNAIKELSTTANLHTTALNTQRDNASDLAAKVNLLVTAVNTQRDNGSDLAAKVNAILTMLDAAGITA